MTLEKATEHVRYSGDSMVTYVRGLEIMACHSPTAELDVEPED